MKEKYTIIPLGRLVTFRDGVIAIIITLMILAIKVQMPNPFDHQAPICSDHHSPD